MSAPIVIPFNFQPAATGALASGTYTVTSNRYAWVTVSAQDGGSATLNGIEVISSFAGTTSTQVTTGVDESATSTGASTTVYTCPSDEYFMGQVQISGNAGDASGDVTVTIDGATFYKKDLTAGQNFDETIPVVMGGTDTQVLEVSISAGTGDTVTCSVTGVQFENRSEWSSDVRTANTISFWAKAGDAIAISGNANIVYSEFNNLS